MDVKLGSVNIPLTKRWQNLMFEDFIDEEVIDPC